MDNVNVEVPLPPEETVRLDGLRDNDGPAGEELAERFTVLENALREVTVIVEVPLEPALTDRLVGLAEREKSAVDVDDTVTDTDVEWARDPLELATVTVYLPGGNVDCAEIVSVELPVPPDETVTLDGLSETANPEDEELADKLTEPENPLIEVIVIVDEPLEPLSIDKELGLAEIE